jgi:hypothetical protein
MIPETLVIAGEAEHVSHSHSTGAQDITLNGEAIAVPADHLEIGLYALLD